MFCFLNLEFPDNHSNGKSLDLSALIDFHFRQEALSDFKCEECKNTCCLKTLSFSSLPLIFVLFVKRFISKKHARSAISIKKEIEISFEKNIQIQNNKYEISSIISHLGKNLNSGHYTADIYDKQKNIWLRCNDEKVEHVSESEVLRYSSRNSYIYFYTKMNH
jgi:uncharacterized UBP type Zn finger protein